MIQVQENIPLAPYTTLRVGGLARYLVAVDSISELEEARVYAGESRLPILILAGGSNTLVSEVGFAGLVVVNQIRGRTYLDNFDDQYTDVIFGSGEVFDDIIIDTIGRNLWGLENLSHIPGSVGATPIQNVGAYGVEVSDVVTAVTAFNLATGDLKSFTHSECQFGYRDSWFKTESGRQWCVVDVTFRLAKTPKPVLSYGDLTSLTKNTNLTQVDIRQAVIDIRAGKFPNWQKVGTAGSFFKNPIVSKTVVAPLQEKYPDLPTYPVVADQVKVSLGFILDKICQLKGYRQGGVGLYDKQALVLVNYDGDATEVQEFADWVRAQVYYKTGITIEQEVRSV